MAKKKIKKRKRRSVKRRKKGSKINKYILPFLVLAACLGIAAFFIIRSFDKEPESFDSDKYFVKGVDVSHHNPVIHWQSVLDQNVTFAYMKATEGTTHVDKHYNYNYELAKETNIRVGSYHFFVFASSGKEQASHFLKIAKFNAGDLLPAIDVEHSPANPYSKDKKYIAQIVNELKVLENELYEHFGVHPIMYTNKDCYKLYIEAHFPDNPIWMCDLYNEPSDDIKNWKIWQFSHKGEIPGVGGYIDLNYYHSSFEEFKELLLP